MIDHSFVRNPLSKVGLERIDTSLDEAPDEVRVPFVSLGIGEIYERHSSLPFIPTTSAKIVSKYDVPLEYAAISPFDKETFGHALIEDFGTLS